MTPTTYCCKRLYNFLISIVCPLCHVKTDNTWYLCIAFIHMVVIVIVKYDAKSVQFALTITPLHA